MRIFALETDIEELKRKFLTESEQAVFVTHRHFLAFLVHIFWHALFCILLFCLIFFLAFMEILGSFLLSVFLALWSMLSLYFLTAAYVAWKYNFLIVTTQKVVIIEQRSLFYQQINPLPLRSINNTRVESQFGGIFRCGILHLNLNVPERVESTVELVNPFIPKPDDVAAIIENGLIVSRKFMKSAEEQEKKKVMEQPAIAAGNPEPATLPEEQKKNEAKKS